MKAGILTIGNEVLDGLVLDTNANWMEVRLTALSAEISRLVAVRDIKEEIGSALDFLIAECELVITSGGLGPTHDDMTLESIAAHLGLRLVENEDALAIVKRQYRMLSDRGIVADSDITEPRKKMTRIPEGSTPLDNSVGGAPGVMIEINNATIFCLPGVPAELKYVFDNSVKPWVQERVSEIYIEKIVEFGFKDESVFAPYIDRAMKKKPGVYVKSMPRRYGSTDVLRVWVSARGDSKQTLEDLVKDTIELLATDSGQNPTYVEGR
ncbi:MAG: competence/damage-inducible protein A [Candidatus Thorarchaeota archaeon]|jgi:molybdenum cofactor synthesis domain-containing protein